MNNSYSLMGRRLTFPALGTVSIFLYCYFFSHDRIFWVDEMLGWTLVTDPNWRHFLTAWRAGADGGGIGYYILGRCWLAIFGHTVASFRLFSAAGISVGLATMYMTLRRFYSQRIVVVALSLVWFGSSTILSQNIQGRFYGMLLGATALAMCAAVRGAEVKPTLGNVCFTITSNLLLIEAHTFGLLYCLAILSGSALSDWLTRRSRLWFYISALLPSLLLIFSLDAIRSSAGIAKPWFWTTKPHAIDLVRFYVPESFHSGIGIVVLSVIAIFLLFSLTRQDTVVSERFSLLIPALLLSLVPAVVWSLSQGGTSYFVERYLIPCAVGIAALIAEVLTIASGDTTYKGPFWRRALGCLAAALLMFVGWYALVVFPRKALTPPRPLDLSLAEALPRGIPVIVEQLEVFVMMRSGPYAAVPTRYVLDWPTAVAPDSPRGFVTNFNEMETWRKLGYLAPDLVTYNDIFRTSSSFAVVDCECSETFDKRFLKRPGWHAMHLADVLVDGQHESIWRIDKVT